jgi:hypothetical protein
VDPKAERRTAQHRRKLDGKLHILGDFTCRDYLAAMANPLAETYLNEANKLDGSNFINWKFKMQTLMEGYGVWNIAKGT